MKASVLLWFFSISFVFLLGLLGDIGLLEGASSAPGIGGLDSETAGGLLSLIVVFSVFSWVVFGFIYDRIPIRFGLLKVIVFGALVSAMEFFLFNTSPELGEVFGPQYDFVGKPIEVLGYFAVFSIVYWRLFEFFKKSEENAPFGDMQGKFAPIHRRIIAYIIGSIVISLISIAILFFSIIGIIGLKVFSGDVNLAEVFEYPLELGFIVFLLVFSIFLFFRFLVIGFYLSVFEGRFGATIGKKIMKIKVVKEDGEQIGFQDAFFRNAPKFIPVIGLVIFAEILFMVFSKKKQRLFDQVAQTIVINEKAK
ncbi:MAG: RDD family protein [archaeon]|nr:RDD family protein [archaeon]